MIEVVLTRLIMPLRWIRRGLLAGYLLLTAFILAHSVNAFVEYSIESRGSESVTLPPESSADTSRRDPTILMESVLTSRLFPLPADAGAGSAHHPVSTQIAPRPPLNVAKQFLLLGTAVSPYGFAILEDLSSKRQTLYRLNDTVSSLGTIVQIEKDRVLFTRDDQQEWLPLAVETLHPGFAPALAASREPVPSEPVPATPLQASPSRRKRIDRQLLVDADNDNTRWLFIHGQPSPFLVDGHVQGIRLDGVNFFGFYGKLGLLTGDVLTRVNGLELHDPTRLPSIVHLLKDDRTFTLDILRNGTPLTLTYDVG